MPSGNGFFSPQPTSVNNFFQKSPYWVIVARTITVLDDSNLLEIIAIPSAVLDNVIEAKATGAISPTCLQSHLRIPNDCEVLNLAFYSDDGNSSLSPNLDIDAESNEGKQSLGLLVKQQCDNCVNEEMWKLQYDDIQFEASRLNITGKEICVGSNIDEVNCPILDDGTSVIKSKFHCD
jgi:hypothetical protein